ncbi:MAG: hypothetical protein Q7J65_01370, partial [Candidatus Marinimicrobia bacterium]|nr:hypothetical protein [Candidatus Neomarinimicrobiota bacterium]
TVSCFHKREIVRYQALSTIDSIAMRLSATCNFIRDYPKSDSLFPAIKSAIELFEKTGEKDQTLQFALDQRIIQPDPEIRQFLDRFLFENLAPDSLTEDKYISDTEEYHQKHPDKLAFALTVIPYLNTCFQSDSIRNLAINRFSKIILQSDYDQIMGLKTLSDQILELDDSLLIPLSNQFLIAAVKNNTPITIRRYFPDAAEPDSIQNQNYYTLYTALAWNAYRQQRFSYALNLMSQASKYGNLENQNGYIILGAVQSQCGELSEGWANVLKGLILNPDAEKQSVEIEDIYTAMFYRIRGSRENPSRFLSQYRRSHR